MVPGTRYPRRSLAALRCPVCVSLLWVPFIMRGGNFLYRKALVPNDPSYGDLWGLNNTGQAGGTADVDIDAPEAWDITTGGFTSVI